MKTDRTDSRSSNPAMPLRLVAGCVLVWCAAGGQPLSVRARAPSGTRPDPEVVLDSSRAASATITPAGGIVTATAADGTRFTLTIPAGALLSDEEVTLTPVASIENLPLSGGLVAAAQVDPERLILWNPAALTIEPPVPVAVSEEMTFAYRGRGTGFHLYPPQLDPSSITIRFARFAGYGVGRGTEADADRIVPEREQDRLEQDLQSVLRAERLARADPSVSVGRVGAGKGKNKLCASMSRIFLLEFDSVRDRMRRALPSGTEADLRCALDRTLEWEQSSRLIPDLKKCLGKKLSSLYREVKAFRIKALEALGNKLYDRCMGEHSFEAVDSLLKLAAEANALLHPDPINPHVLDSGFGPVVVKISVMARECAKFELVFESNIHIEAPNPGGSVFSIYDVRAVVPVQYTLENGFSGQADLTYVDCHIFSASGECTWKTTTQKSTFKVLAVGYSLNVRSSDVCEERSSPPPERESPVQAVAIDPGRPREFWTVQCVGAPPISGSGAVWVGQFMIDHQSEIVANTLKLAGWERGDGETVAIRNYDLLNCQGHCTEKTTVRFVHTPHR